MPGCFIRRPSAFQPRATFPFPHFTRLHKNSHHHPLSTPIHPFSASTYPLLSTRIAMAGPEVSHGRGGAGNINPDDTQYVDGEVVRTGTIGSHGDGAFSTGRGGMPLIFLRPQAISLIPKHEMGQTVQLGTNKLHSKSTTNHAQSLIAKHLQRCLSQLMPSPWPAIRKHGNSLAQTRSPHSAR